MNKHTTKPRGMIFTGIATILLAFLLLPLANADQNAGAEASCTSCPGDAINAATEECKAHGVNVEQCYICDPEKREKGRLWCGGHDRYEDRCWLCQPQLEDKERAYCQEHFLYEDECFYCDPAKAVSSHAETSSDTVTSSPLWCKEHDVAEIECGICQPQLAAQLEVGKEMKIRFGSSESSASAGIVANKLVEGFSQPSVKTFFEATYNRNRLALITPLADGVVRTVHADVGDIVKAGEVLVEIHSDEVATAKGDYLSSMIKVRTSETTYTREKKLAEENISAKRDLVEAEANLGVARLNHRIAKQRLLNLGFTEKEVAEIAAKEDSSSLFQLRAPFAGTLVERNAVIGESVKEGKELFKLADLSSMWLDLSISPEYAALVQRGQVVKVRFDGSNMSSLEAVITWVDSAIDSRNRMLKARAVIENTDGRIRQGMFGYGDITISERGQALLLPQEAVQYHENRPYVFVKEGADLYKLRHVRLGHMLNDQVAIVEGISPEEEVVTAGAFIAMSEFLKSRLGAGCVDD